MGPGPVSPAAQQRVNPNSNTERGGLEVKQVPGRKIGNVTTKGNLVLLELDEGVISNQNLFDLDKRTIRFTPVAGGEATSAAFARRICRCSGTPPPAPRCRARPSASRSSRFRFPARPGTRSRCRTPGLIGFGGGYNNLGFDRFIHMQTAGAAMVNKIPVIAAFMKLRMNGTRYVNELDDRLVVTWDVSEPTSGQQDVTFVRTPHNYPGRAA